MGAVSTFPDRALLNAGGVLLGIHREGGNRKSHPGGIVISLTTKDIDQTYRTPQSKGIRFPTPIRKEGSGEVASCNDPGGYEIELWEPPEKSRT